MTLIAVAVLSGCATSAPPLNPSLTAAHSSYDSARSNPEVTTLAALELKEAGDTLTKADEAFSKGQGTATVDHLAYIANQQVGIAQETAKRKTAELAVTNAGAKRTEVRLEARTAEADAAKRQAAISQETVDQQAAELAAASANAERDQALIAQQEAQLRELDAKKTARGMVITLGDVLFRTNKAQLESGGMRNVQKLADFLNRYPQHRVLVEGFTDSTGSDSYNQELSDRRANAVRMALINMGVSSDRVTTRGYGEAFPVGGNDTAAGRQSNRRVEIIISDSKGNIAPR
ncbi:MAG: flagellar motor protein MotB [Gallionellales bacterium RBG_16_56_9]|nr:MAG: flagellar motor protein MotB [Gallionellales bacterium RBG_16_56_9]